VRPSMYVNIVPGLKKNRHSSLKSSLREERNEFFFWINRGFIYCLNASNIDEAEIEPL